MKEFLIYVVAVLGNILLYQLSGQWEGIEWLFALLILGLFALAIQGWKRYSSRGFGLIFLTAIGLFTINSILYLLMPTIFIILFSLLFGLVLMPLYMKYRYPVLASWWIVLFNILMYLEISNDTVLFWFTIITTGVGALIGFRQQSKLFKYFFTGCFLLSAGGSVLINLVSNDYLMVFFIMLIVVFFAVGAYLFERKSNDK